MFLTNCITRLAPFSRFLCSITIFGLPSAHCTAVSFLSFDARSLSMGGTGVVTARSHNATLFNPALLIELDQRRQGRLHFHSYVGARLIDRDNFIETAEHFQKRYDGMSLDDLLDDSLDFRESRFEAGQELRHATRRVRTFQVDINELSNKPLRASGSFGLAFAYPGQKWSFGGYHREFAVLGSVVRIADQDNAAIFRVTETIDRFADVLDQVVAISEEAEQADGVTLEQAADRAERFWPSVEALDVYLDFDRLVTDVRAGATNGRNVQDYLREPLPEAFFSTIDSEGAQVKETAISLARSFDEILPRALHVGINLKAVDFTTISFEQLVDDFSLSAYSKAENRRRYQRLNLDLGIRYDLGDGLFLGVVGRNLVPYDFATVSGKTMTLRPSLRAGLGYVGSNLNLSVDLNLTRNEPLGFDPDKQFLAVGAEWFVWRNTALRAGLRTNLVDGETLPSIGFGVGSHHGHVDLGLARSFNGDEWGLGLQAGLSF